MHVEAMRIILIRKRAVIRDLTEEAYLYWMSAWILLIQTCQIFSIEQRKEHEYLISFMEKYWLLRIMT